MPTETAGPIHSQFRGDPDLCELLEQFVDAARGRRETLAASFAAGFISEVAQQAHQIKGAGGGYGYASLSEAAARLEAACRSSEQNIDQIGQLLQELIDQLTRVSV